MTEKDKQLIARAKERCEYDWGELIPLKDQCDTDETKKIIHDMMTRQNHIEEAMAGMI